MEEAPAFPSGLAALARALPPRLALRALPGARRRGLVAAAPISRGEELLREAALLWQAHDGGVLAVADAAPSAAHVDALLAAAAPFYGDAASAEGAGAGSDGDGWRSSFSVTAGTARSRAADLVCDVNALRVVEDDDGGEDESGGGRGFFPLLGLCNHSCSPSCSITQVSFGLRNAAAPPVYALVARRDLAAGEELTFAYVPRSWPLARRKAALHASYSFDCDCPRCADGGDDTFVLRCRAAACAAGAGGRVFFGARACADCGAPADAADQARAAAAGGSEGLLGPLPPELPLAARANALLKHELLAHEDAGIFAALCALLGDVQEAAESAAGDGVSELLDAVARGVAHASLRTPFTSPQDLGIDVEIDEAE